MTAGRIVVEVTGLGGGGERGWGTHHVMFWITNSVPIWLSKKSKSLEYRCTEIFWDSMYGRTLYAGGSTDSAVRVLNIVLLQGSRVLAGAWTAERTSARLRYSLIVATLGVVVQLYAIL